MPLQHLLNDPLVKWLFSRRDVLLCLIFSLHSFYWKCYVQNQQNSLIFPNCILYFPYKKLFLQRMNFKLSPHSLILHLLLYDIMFYGCFSKPINFNQSAKFLPLGVLKLYSKLKIAMNALYLPSNFTWIMRHINSHIWALKQLNHLHLCLYGSMMKGGMLCLISYLNHKKGRSSSKDEGDRFSTQKKNRFSGLVKKPRGIQSTFNN